jgi:arylsulfatase A-like enzyme
MGNRIIQTPNLDKLANEGALFTNAYVTTAISCSSRASLLTGQYVSRHGVDDFAKTFSEENLQNTYPMQLRSAGYKTGFIGKYGVGGYESQPKDSFDYWVCDPETQPKYELTDSHGYYVHHTDRLNRDAAQFLDNYAGKDEPFCLSISFKAPHVQDEDIRQFIPHPRYNKYYQDVTIPQPETGAYKYWELFPEFFKASNEARFRWYLRFATPEMYQRSVKNYYRLITQVDDMVGDLRHQLKRLGVDKNTIIIFMGDNGLLMGEHGMAGKWYIYEESIRVPLIIYDPTAPENQRGKKVTSIALNIDIAPTILSFAGLPVPPVMQGRNLTETLQTDHSTWRTDFFYEHPFQHPTIPKSEGVVSEKYKYVVYYEQNPVYEEFFDLQIDPHETRNLINDGKYKSIINEYKKEYQELKQQAQ